MAESIGPMWSISNQTWGRDRAASRQAGPVPGKRTRREDHALLIVRDEFRPAIPRSGWSPPEPVSATGEADYHALSRGPGKRGHFYFARKGTFLLCLDMRYLFA